MLAPGCMATATLGSEEKSSELSADSRYVQGISARVCRDWRVIRIACVRPSHARRWMWVVVFISA